MEMVLPSISELALYIQQYANLVIESGDSFQHSDAEFIMLQLLKIAKHVDYSDEVGRQKMHSLMRI